MFSSKARRTMLTLLARWTCAGVRFLLTAGSAAVGLLPLLSSSSLESLSSASAAAAHSEASRSEIREASGAVLEVAVLAVLASLRASWEASREARFFGAKGASLAQRAAARLLQSSAALEARGGEGQREADLEAAADAAADAARDLVLTRPAPKASASAAAAPAAAAAAKEREVLDGILLCVGFLRLRGQWVGFGGLWLAAVLYRQK